MRKLNGVADCVLCHHKWATRAEPGVLFVECPKCHVLSGLFVFPCLIEGQLLWISADRRMGAGEAS